MFTRLDASPPRPAGDPYARLGLPRGATTVEVKRAYRRLAKRFHPDRAGEKATATFLDIQAAYRWLLADPRPPASIAGSSTRARRAATRPIRFARPSRLTRKVAWVPRENTGWAAARWYWEDLRDHADRPSPVTSAAPRGSTS